MPLINREIEQNSPEWVAAKIGKPSASNANRLITSIGAPSKSLLPFAQELAEDKVAGQAVNAWGGNAYTERGHELEEEARMAYEIETGSDVEEVGYIEDDLQRYIVSPDGLVGDRGMVEIKCLPKKHGSTLVYYAKNNRIPPDYIPQLQMQLFVSQREWVDLYYYSPLLPNLCVRVFPDGKLFSSLENQLTTVLLERNRIIQILESFK